MRELKGHPTRQRICFGLGGYPPLSILREGRGWDEACGQKARYEGAARPARDARKRTACLREVIHCGCFLPDSKANPIFPMRRPTREPRISIPFRLARTLARLGTNAQGGGIIELMRKATLDAMERRRLTAYRVCKTLGLNLGNVYAYLGKGDVSKVSRNTARRIMEYATG